MNDHLNGWGKNGVGQIIQAVLRAVGVALGLFMLAIAIPLFFFCLFRSVSLWRFWR